MNTTSGEVSLSAERLADTVAELRLIGERFSRKVAIQWKVDGGKRALYGAWFEDVADIIEGLQKKQTSAQESDGRP